MMTTFISCSEKETLDIGYNLAKDAKAGDIFCLSGPLGAGKTVFARGFASGLGFIGRVTSPTFCIMNVYEGGRLALYHFDAYRATACEMLEIGIEDFLYGGGVCLIEWAENLAVILPENAVGITIKVVGEERHVCISH